jgi:hypothetical protein
MVMRIFVLFFLPLTLYSQITINVHEDTFSRETPLIGFNTNAHHSIANWKIPAFRDSAALLAPAIYRYPGGTTANHWDWKTGWFQNAPTTPPEFSNIHPKNIIRAEEFKLGVDAAQTEALFNINFQYSTLEYEQQGLQHAESLGFPIRYIEIGNEHNLKVSNQYIAPEIYAKGVKVWADTLKNIFPHSKICAVGGATPALPGWLDSLLVESPKIDAIAFHAYLGAGNSDSLLNVQRALSIPFAQLNQRYSAGKFTLLPETIDVWVTEFNMGELLAGDPEQHAERWVHALYVASMLHLFLENPKITMIVNHNLTNQMEFAAISPYDFHITANGVIMKIFGEVSKGTSTSVRLSFASLSSQQWGSTVFPKLFGWKFIKANEERGIIVNLSSDTVMCDLHMAFGKNATVHQIWNDPLKIISGRTDLLSTSGTTASVFAVMPYSVVQIMQMQTTLVRPNISEPQKFALHQNYPNPFNPSTNIEYSLETPGFTTLRIFDALGRSVSILVNDYQNEGTYFIPFHADPFPSGIYFYRLESNGRAVTKKMILLK